MSASDSVARCAICPPNLTIFLFGWRVKFGFGGGGFFGYLWNISAENLDHFCTTFRPVFGS